MSRPTISEIETALGNIHTSLTSDGRRAQFPFVNAAIDSLGYTARRVMSAYKPNVTLTVTDEADADLAAFFGSEGELRVAKDYPVTVGDVFGVTGTGDTTDDALEGAKGSAVADGDRFEVTGIDGSEAVKFLGNGDVDISSYSLDRGAG